MSRVLSALFLLTALGTSKAPALARWFYVSQNLWVDQNITNIVA